MISSQLRETFWDALGEMECPSGCDVHACAYLSEDAAGHDTEARPDGSPVAALEAMGNETMEWQAYEQQRNVEGRLWRKGYRNNLSSINSTHWSCCSCPSAAWARIGPSPTERVTAHRYLYAELQKSL
jgi:hypothetical protein